MTERKQRFELVVGDSYLDGPMLLARLESHDWSPLWSWRHDEPEAYDPGSIALQVAIAGALINSGESLPDFDIRLYAPRDGESESIIGYETLFVRLEVDEAKIQNSYDKLRQTFRNID